jgi:N6-adenosine-specific RNA methylase IME4
MEIEVSKLKDYPLNKKLFDSLPRDEYSALKTDIAKRGIKTELHILPDFTVICGHQRLMVAQELHLKKLPCKIIVGLETPEQVEEYVIKDNLLRRQLKTEQRYLLLSELSKIYEKGRGGDRKSDVFKDATVASLNEDVNILTAKESGSTPRTVARAREYSHIIENRPELRGQKANVVIRKIKHEKQVKEIKVLEPLKGKFNVIVCDPPWGDGAEYDPDGFRGPGNYPKMTMAEIKAIKLPADDDCILWLWGIDLFLKETLEVIEAWGFERKSTLVWVKDKFGLGHWLRNQHEYCFLCIKGKPVFHGENIPSILHAPRQAHSEKPDEFYVLAEKASPYKAKLDYFARKKREGWICYGDEVK